MRPSIAVLVLLASVSARAQERPLLLKIGSLEATALGNYSDWSTGTDRNGESLALGLDYGLTDQLQLGLALGLPINPGFGFGSVVLDSTFGLTPSLAVRLDAGVERVGMNGSSTSSISEHASRYFIGAGPYLRVPIAPAVDFVWGRSGVARAFRFTNLGLGGSADGGFYLGGSYFPLGWTADTLVFSSGDNDTGEILQITLPLGIAFHPSQQLSLTLQAGYSGVVVWPPGTGSSSFVLHYVPVGLEAAFAVAPAAELGLNLTFDGYLGASGTGAPSNGPSYFDLRTVLFWFKFRTGT